MVGGRRFMISDKYLHKQNHLFRLDEYQATTNTNSRTRTSSTMQSQPVYFRDNEDVSDLDVPPVSKPIAYPPPREFDEISSSRSHLQRYVPFNGGYAYAEILKPGGRTYPSKFSSTASERDYSQYQQSPHRNRKIVILRELPNEKSGDAMAGRDEYVFYPRTQDQQHYNKTSTLPRTMPYRDFAFSETSSQLSRPHRFSMDSHAYSSREPVGPNRAFDTSRDSGYSKSREVSFYPSDQRMPPVEPGDRVITVSKPSVPKNEYGITNVATPQPEPVYNTNDNSAMYHPPQQYQQHQSGSRKSVHELSKVFEQQSVGNMDDGRSPPASPRRSFQRYGNSIRPQDSLACSVCQKPVYAVELFKAFGRAFHKSCFRCSICNRALNASTYAVNANGIVICQAHQQLNMNTRDRYGPDEVSVQESISSLREPSYHNHRYMDDSFSMPPKQGSMDNVDWRTNQDELPRANFISDTKQRLDDIRMENENVRGDTSPSRHSEYKYGQRRNYYY